MSYWLDFLSTVVGGGVGAYCGITLARRHYRKQDAKEHDRQMADWDARLDALRRLPARGPRLFSPN